MTLCLACPTGWLISLFLVASSGPIYADETPVLEDVRQRQAAERAYQQAIVRFNTNIKGFDSWEAFKGAVFSRLERHDPGRCYELTASSIEPVTITKALFHKALDGKWEKTSGGGWRKRNEDRTFIEYRYNIEADALLWIEGVNPRFFFASTRRLCEFPLSAKQDTDPSS